MTFLTRIYHCNIDSHGTVCVDVLKERWSSCMTVNTVLLAILSLMHSCNPGPCLSLIPVPYNRCLQTMPWSVRSPSSSSTTETSSIALLAYGLTAMRGDQRFL